MGKPRTMASSVSHGHDLSFRTLPVDDQLDVQLPACQEDVPGHLGQNSLKGTLPDDLRYLEIVAEVEDGLAPERLRLPGSLEGMQDEELPPGGTLLHLLLGEGEGEESLVDGEVAMEASNS